MLAHLLVLYDACFGASSHRVVEMHQGWAAWQVGGGQARWELFHQLHLLERAAKRMPASLELAAAVSVPSTDVGWHALNSQLHWAVPVLLQLVTLLHSLWTPDVRSPAGCDM